MPWESASTRQRCATRSGRWPSSSAGTLVGNSGCTTTDTVGSWMLKERSGPAPVSAASTWRGRVADSSSASICSRVAGERQYLLALCEGLAGHLQLQALFLELRIHMRHVRREYEAGSL